MNSYYPSPIDTATIQLSQELQELTELLARNAHDIWALQRIREGWTFGPERNDQTKQHPDLIPYERLSDSEKEYDRKTAMQTLKAIVALGYTIRRNMPSET